MRKRDLKVGQSYAYWSGRGGFHLYNNSYRMRGVIRATEPVTVLDLNYDYQRKISTWSPDTYPSKGIRIQKADGETIVLPSGQRLVMPWKSFDEQVNKTRKEIQKEEREEQEAQDKAEKLVKRAGKVKVPVLWNGNADDSEFELSQATLESVIERLEKKK